MAFQEILPQAIERVTRPRRMSYSSRKDLHTCARKWFFKKVKRVDRDDDLVEDDIHLRLGTAYHSLLELCKEHMRATPEQAHFFAIELDLEPLHEGQILAMARAYAEFFKKLEVESIGFELRLLTDSIVGYVDRIYHRPSDGAWWIVDHKTAKKMANGLPERLLRDEQLASYYSLREQICEELKLDLNKFAGCCYTVCHKPNYVIKTGETPAEYAARIEPKIEICQYTFMPDDKFARQTRGGLEADWIYQQCTERAFEQNPETLPGANFNACFDYFRPCPYWSQCYGVKFSESVKLIDSRSTKHGTVTPLEIARTAEPPAREVFPDGLDF